jgi:large subunit ribosomal protein L27
MATHKGGGSSRNGRDSPGQRLGMKAYGGQFVNAGSIIVRQRGTRFGAGRNTGLGKDHTVYAKVSGKVCFKFNGVKKRTDIEISTEE